MQDSYYKKTEFEINQMKKYSYHAYWWSIIGLTLSGWTYWTWTEEPERPAPINFNISSLTNNNLQMSLSYNF
jgi:hypothetical protein